ncbi:TauD/TfdA dioxygenase family protein [Engelhardtia mirabilis]|uniref:TauD/TfdA dioxygenase family protein n=1 Tax=Engelhardtia mirabilis TaxID=2528011 RepID=UPI003AF39940
MQDQATGAPPNLHLPAGAEFHPPAAGAIGAEFHGLDPRQVDGTLAARIRDLVWDHKLVVFRGVDLSEPEYIAFARALGEPQVYFQPNYHHPRHPEIFVSSNVPMDGRKVGVANTGAYWHTDYQFFPEPLPMTMVRPIEIPSGSRGTSYVDMQRALEELPPDLREFVLGARAIHEAKWRYKIQPSDVDKSITQILEEFGAETPTVSHPAVITHPVNGRRCLYVSRGFTVGFEGLSIEAGRQRLDAILEHVERADLVHTHLWTKGDLLLWDNRQVIHRAGGGASGEASVSYRIGVYDGRPFYADEPRGRLV